MRKVQWFSTLSQDGTVTPSDIVHKLKFKICNKASLICIVTVYFSGMAIGQLLVASLCEVKR